MTLNKSSTHKMKYFTPEMWAESSSSDDAVIAANMRKWMQSINAYRKHIHALAPRLGPSGRRFFIDFSAAHHGMHILSLQGADYPLKNLTRQPRRWHQTSIGLIALAWVEDNTPRIVILRYMDIDEWNITTRNDLFSLPRSTFGEWGYDELLAEGRSAYRHNILFQTGTQLSIVFKRLSFRTLRASNQRIQSIVNPLRGLPNSDS